MRLALLIYIRSVQPTERPRPVHGRADAHVIGQILHRTNGGDGWATVKNILHCHLAHFGGSNAIDPLFHLVHWDTAVVAKHLTPNIFADRCSSIQVQQHASVSVANVERLEAVTQPIHSRGNSQLGCVVHATTLRTIPSPDEGGGHHQRHMVLLGPAATLDCDCDMG
uniref:Uncharacterized protein n=1 Tax=Anopheles melas TaxID=34690 RepID=A0A182U7I1_9DIPT